MGVTICLYDPYDDDFDNTEYASISGRYTYVHCLRRGIIVIVNTYIDNKIIELVKQFYGENAKTYTIDDCISYINECDDNGGHHTHIEDLIETKKIFSDILEDQTINYNKVDSYARDENAKRCLSCTDLYGAFKFINHSEYEGYFSKGECVDINNTFQLINQTYKSLYDSNEIFENENGNKMYKNKIIYYDEDLIKLFAQAVELHKCVILC